MIPAKNPTSYIRIELLSAIFRSGQKGVVAAKNKIRQFTKPPRNKSFFLWQTLLIGFCLICFAVNFFAQTNQSRLAAEKIQSEADALFSKNTPEARAEAAPKYTAALELWRELGDQKQQVEALNKLVDIHSFGGDYAKSLEHSERLLPMARKLGDKNLEGGVLGNIGWYYHALGETRKGLHHLEKSAEILHQIGEKQREGSALSGVGVMNYQLGEIQKAFDIYTRVLALRREIGDRRGEALTLINLGYAYSNGGDKQKAVEVYEQALKIALEIKDSATESLIVNNLGSVWQDFGEFQKAFDAYQKSLALRRQNGNKYDVAATLTNIASLYRDLGDFENALKFIEQSFEIFRTGGFRREEARSLSSMGTIYKLTGDKTKALDFLRRSLEIHKSLENKEGHAVVLRNIGKLYLDENEFQKAAENFQPALRLAEEVGDKVSVADILVLTARASEKLKNLPDAEADYARALSIQREIGLLPEAAETLFHYAKFDDGRGRRVLAVEKMTEVFRIIEDLRNSITGQNLRSSYLAEQQKYFDFYIYLLVSQHRLEPEKGFDALALRTAERARARSLLESVDESQADIRAGIAPELLAREKLLRQIINAKEALRLNAAGQKNSADTAAFEKEISAAVEKYRDLQTEIRAKSPQYAALTNPEPLGLAEIQAQVLDENSILLEYSLGAERSFLFAVTKTNLEIYELPKREIIEKSARQTIEKIKSADENVKTDLVELSRMLLAPVAAKIQNKRLLIVAPGILQYVPFAALQIPDSKFQIPKDSRFQISDSKLKTENQESGIWNLESGMTYLVETNEIVNLPSASVLALLRQNKTRPAKPKNTVAILADPVFTKDDARLKTLAKQSAVSNPANGAAAVMREIKITPPQLRSDFGRLRFSRLEADAISALARNGQKFVAMDFAANLQAANGEEFQKSGIVHLATHGVINSDFPELSGVVLSLIDENGSPQDGFLRLHDIYNLRLDASLVVLSACETALGREVKGEGIVGLTRGFMYAGATTVVASLWKVDDRATADLMRHFYQKMLKDNLRPADALRRAQIMMLTEKPTQNPFFWAAFTVQGEYR